METRLINMSTNAPTVERTDVKVNSAAQTEDVFEVYGKTADALGWDFMVCKSLSEALHVAESELDALEEGEEVRIVFKRYSQAQMDEVVYE